MKLHELKTWPPFFQDIKDEKKTFDVRPDDRNFKVGDYLLLWEWNPDAEDYTGREILVEIVYKVPGGQFGIMDGFCVLGIMVSNEDGSS